MTPEQKLAEFVNNCRREGVTPSAELLELQRKVIAQWVSITSDTNFENSKWDEFDALCILRNAMWQAERAGLGAEPSVPVCLMTVEVTP